MTTDVLVGRRRRTEEEEKGDGEVMTCGRAM